MTFSFFSFFNVAVFAKFEILMALLLEIQSSGIILRVACCIWMGVFKSLIYDIPLCLQYKIKTSCKSFQHNSLIDKTDFCVFTIYSNTMI
jgi:hypothetical protein